MHEVRLGVIGCGGMAQQGHMKAFPEVSRLRFVAASDVAEANLQKVVAEHGVKGFARAEDMLDSGLLDAVVIATPHFFHPTYAIAAFERGLHVLTEKPVAVTAKAAAEAERAHAERPDLKYAAMFQMRTAPKWRKAREIIASGQLGPIQRVQWTITNWFRTQAYYDSGSWRATWAGEGGGVLLNQCPHNLDMLCWLAGTPRRVHAHLSLGKYHDIEVEDEVTAFFEYENGATGVFVTGTGEAPGNDTFEIAGDRGRLVISPGNPPPGGGPHGLELTLNDTSAREFARTSKGMWGAPATTRITLQTPEGGGHKAIHQNFVNAILDGEPLLAPAAEGLASVELANAMIQSGLTGKAVDLPMDREGYEAFLGELMKGSKYKG